MRAAAEAGIAPAVHHADPDGGRGDHGFRAATPAVRLSRQHRRSPGARSSAMPCSARLQATPAFPPVVRLSATVRLESCLARLLEFRSVRTRACSIVTGRALSASGEAYPWDSAALVSSHNDLSPGEHSVRWPSGCGCIDWETAYRNDPLVDVATAVSIFFAALAGDWRRCCCGPGLAGSRIASLLRPPRPDAASLGATSSMAAPPASMPPTRWHGRCRRPIAARPRTAPGRSATSISRRPADRRSCSR